MASIRYRAGGWQVRWREKGPNGEAIQMQETYRTAVQAGTRRGEIEILRVESRYNDHGNRNGNRRHDLAKHAEMQSLSTDLDDGGKCKICRRKTPPPERLC